MFIRLIHQNDLFDIFLWRNNSKTILYSLKSKKITFFQHLNWFRKSLVNPNIKMYIGLKKINHKLSKIGVVRFDIKKNFALVSINLNPDFRGKKFSIQLLKLCIKNFFNFKKINLKATIKNNNFPSIKCFLKNGFVDSFRAINKEPHNYTWWSYRAGARANNKGWRIDYCLVSAPLKDRIKRAFILAEAKHSDHCPTAVEIE